VSAKSDALYRSILDKLLQKAERAWEKGTVAEPTLLFSEASLPEYFRLPHHDDKAALHASLREAERQGCIALEWDRRAGADGQIVRARLVSADLTAGLLGRQTAWAGYVLAESLLSPWREVIRVGDVLQRWRIGKPVRGLKASDAQDIADACRVIAACLDGAREDDIPMRRLSGQLFSDTKRIEAIIAALDVLSAETMEPPWRETDDVLNGLGLVKMPMPILMAGRGIVDLADGTEIAIPYPYVGLSPSSIQRIRLATPGAYVLTVENLTTFHELALGKAGKGGKPAGLIIYTAGMPSPAFMGVYERTLSDAMADSRVVRYHWGDIDVGGFRIAMRLKNAHPSPLSLWNMDPAQYPGVVARKTLSSDDRREIWRIAVLNGWAALAEIVSSDGRAIEQEVLPLSLPGV